MRTPSATPRAARRRPRTRSSACDDEQEVVDMAEPTWKPTACILCECNCGLEVQLGGADARHLVKLRGDKRHPSSQGYACEKAHRLDHYQHGVDRVTRPLR